MKLRTKDWDGQNGRFVTTEIGDFGLIEIEDEFGNMIQVDTPNDPERPGLVIFSPHGELILSMKADGTGGAAVTVEQPDGAEGMPRPELVSARVLQMPTGKGTVDLTPSPDCPVQAKPVHVPGKWTPDQMRQVVKDQKFPCPRCGEPEGVSVEAAEDGTTRAACEKCGTAMEATLVSADDAKAAVEKKAERKDGGNGKDDE